MPWHVSTTTNNQQPTINNQQPTTNNQQSTTNNQPPTTNLTAVTPWSEDKMVRPLAKVPGDFKYRLSFSPYRLGNKG
ncbi:hypothetical protein [Fischerella sp. PCC 9605]|uniref:hypothetical protein n=1 Tax=Fischerella sp. PCC 9605 TaxID=1173024 RepID=UPI0005531F36|nr:hypothetical protein [Fischerella sp. PCC 9605]